MFSDNVGVVAVSDPTAVAAVLVAKGQDYDNGGILCTCPELGFVGANMLYCRYALSLPYYKVKDGDQLWIRPTIGEDERWIYTGFVDCGRSSVVPITGTQGIIENEAGTFDITIGTMSIDINSITGIFNLIAGTTCKIEMAVATNKITLTAGTNVMILDGTANKITMNGVNLEVLV
jgi:hypothetical protein